MPEEPTPQAGATRWELIRDIAVFQLKLGVDALRDLALVPVSLVAGAIDLISGGDRPGRLFYDLLNAGRRSEHWINLFGNLDSDGNGRSAQEPRETVDSVVSRLEHLIVEQYERGGMTATAKDAIDRSLDAFSAPNSEPRRLPGGEEPEP